MLRKGLLFIAALGLVVASAPSARADICFQYQKSGGGYSRRTRRDDDFRC